MRLGRAVVAAVGVALVVAGCSGNQGSTPSTQVQTPSAQVQTPSTTVQTPSTAVQSGAPTAATSVSPAPRPPASVSAAPRPVTLKFPRQKSSTLARTTYTTADTNSFTFPAPKRDSWTAVAACTARKAGVTMPVEVATAKGDDLVVSNITCDGQKNVFEHDGGKGRELQVNLRPGEQVLRAYGIVDADR